MNTLAKLRVVLVHDWLTGMRGGEKCLEIFCRQWPQARLLTLLHRRGSVCADIENLKPEASFFRFFPQVHRYYRYLLPLMPAAAGWKAHACDLVLSTSHCVAKSCQPPPGVPHVCYCFTPMRYAWHMKASYFQGGGIKARLRDRLLEKIRAWDRATSERVSHFVAISQAVRRRISDCYGRDSAVIYPPVDTDFYTPDVTPREDHYLLFSAFAPYKRLDLAIEACNLLKRNLIVIGSGQDEKKLRSLAGPTVRFLGWQSGTSIRDHMRRCRALLFPGEEDFGIVPLEAQACGTPVIAFAQGGATETVVPLQGHWQGIPSPPTGLWFHEQTPACLADAIQLFEKNRDAFDTHALRQHAVRFHPDRFLFEINAFLSNVVQPRAVPMAA